MRFGRRRRAGRFRGRRWRLVSPALRQLLRSLPHERSRWPPTRRGHLTETRLPTPAAPPVSPRPGPIAEQASSTTARCVEVRVDIHADTPDRAIATRFNDPTWSWPTRPTPPGQPLPAGVPRDQAVISDPSDWTGHRQRKASGVGDHPRPTPRPSCATWSSARSGPSSIGVGSQPVTAVMT